MPAMNTMLQGLLALTLFPMFTALPAWGADISLGATELRVMQGTALEEDYSEMLFKFLLAQAKQTNEKRVAQIGRAHV